MQNERASQFNKKAGWNFDTFEQIKAQSNELNTLSFFNKNIVFPAETEYSYLSPDCRLKIFLWKFLYSGVWHFCFWVIWCLNGVKLSQPAGIKAWYDVLMFLQKC